MELVVRRLIKIKALVLQFKAERKGVRFGNNDQETETSQVVISAGVADVFIQEKKSEAVAVGVKHFAPDPVFPSVGHEILGISAVFRSSPESILVHCSFKTDAAIRPGDFVRVKIQAVDLGIQPGKQKQEKKELAAFHPEILGVLNSPVDFLQAF